MCDNCIEDLGSINLLSILTPELIFSQDKYGGRDQPAGGRVFKRGGGSVAGLSQLASLKVGVHGAGGR